MSNTDQYILWSVQKGGWLSKSAFTHSDYRQGTTYSRSEALDMIKLHSGRLVPVDRALYIEAIREVKP